MKTTKIVQLIPALLFLTVTFCVNTPRTATAGGRFHESKSVDVALEYSGWDTIVLTKPDSHEGGFYPILTRDNVAAEISHYNTGHNLAVVSINDVEDMTPEKRAAVIHDWETLLGNCGFHRVVFLRAEGSDKIDGLPIVQDSVIAAVRDDSTKSSATVAMVTSAH